MEVCDVPFSCKCWVSGLSAVASGCVGGRGASDSRSADDDRAHGGRSRLGEYLRVVRLGLGGGVHWHCGNARSSDASGCNVASSPSVSFRPLGRGAAPSLCFIGGV